MTAELLSRLAAELAMFAGIGFLLFALNDLVVDLIFFVRAGWRGLTHRPTCAADIPLSGKPGLMAVLVPAWDEAAVIAAMLRATLERLDYPDYRILVGHYRNDPATAAAIASVADPRIEPVLVEADGPTRRAPQRPRPCRLAPARRRQGAAGVGRGADARRDF